MLTVCRSPHNLKITGLIYMHRITDPRVGGSSYRHLNLFKAMCGVEALQNAVYVTNMWSNPPEHTELLREAELETSADFFGDAIAAGAKTIRHLGTRESAHRIVGSVLGKAPTVTNLQRQLIEQAMRLQDTDAGRLLGDDLENALMQHHLDMEDLYAQQERAREQNNQELIKRLETKHRKAEERGRQLAEQLKFLSGSKSPLSSRRRVHSANPRLGTSHPQHLGLRGTASSRDSNQRSQPVPNLTPSARQRERAKSSNYLSPVPSSKSQHSQENGCNSPPPPRPSGRRSQSARSSPSPPLTTLHARDQVSWATPPKQSQLAANSPSSAPSTRPRAHSAHPKLRTSPTQSDHEARATPSSRDKHRLSPPVSNSPPGGVASRRPVSDASSLEPPKKTGLFGFRCHKDGKGMTGQQKSPSKFISWCRRVVTYYMNNLT